MAETQNPGSAPMSGRHQRRLRNLLIDKEFQLRFTLVGVLVSAGLCAGLGTVVIWQMRDATAQFREQRLKATALFGQQREATTKLMRDTRSAALADVKKLLKVATDMLDVQEKDPDPGVRESAKIAKGELVKDDQQRLARRAVEDEQFNRLRQKADKELVLQRQRDDDTAYSQRKHKELVLLVTIVVFGVVFVVIIFLFNIVITHKVAGPLFKVGRFFDELREGTFTTPWPLRKGDQLVEFYERFRAMHGAVKDRMVEDVKVLEAVLKDCEAKGVTGEGVDQVRTALEAKKKSLAPSAPPPKAAEPGQPG